MDYRHPNAAFNKSEEERQIREAIAPTAAQTEQWRKEAEARRKSVVGKQPYTASTPETQKKFWEQDARDHAELVRILNDQKARAADEYFMKDPDQWSEQFRMSKILAWRERFRSMTYMDLYEILLKDEGYWYQVNGLIANLPPEPGKLHTSVEDTFYTFTVPWAGVRVDWLQSLPVIGGWVTSNEVGIARGLKDYYRGKHERPRGMGIELSYLNARHKTSNAVDNLTSGPSITTILFGLGALAIVILLR